MALLAITLGLNEEGYGVEVGFPLRIEGDPKIVGTEGGSELF